MKRTEETEKLLMFQVMEIPKVIHQKSSQYLGEAGAGLQVEQIPVLMIPHYMGIISQQEIADRCSRDKSSVLRSVASLQASGLVAVAPDPFDKRRKLISLTAEGKKKAQRVNDQLARINEEIFSSFSEEERDTFRRLLVKLEQSITQK
jgi:DNA-binding MarR family transcriptional regulator